MTFYEFVKIGYLIRDSDLTPTAVFNSFTFKTNWRNQKGITQVSNPYTLTKLFPCFGWMDAVTSSPHVLPV